MRKYIHNTRAYFLNMTALFEYFESIFTQVSVDDTQHCVICNSRCEIHLLLDLIKYRNIILSEVNNSLTQNLLFLYQINEFLYLII